VLLTIPLCVQILRKKAEQNPLTILLWSTLDGIAAGSIYLEGGNYLQAICLSVSGLIVVYCILKTTGIRKLGWEKTDTLTTLLVVFCVTVWVYSGSLYAALASSCAIVLAGIPQVIDTKEKPDTTPTMIYIGYTASNLLAVFGGKDFSVVEVGYQLAAFITCIIVTYFSIRKKQLVQFFFCLSALLFSFRKVKAEPV
jgi:hypothetical protein